MRFAVTAFLLFIALPLVAQNRSYDVLEYRAELTFDIEHLNIAGAADILLRNTSRSPIQQVDLDLRDNAVSSVRVSNVRALWEQNDSVLTVTFPRELSSLDSTTVSITYAGTHNPVIPGTYGTGVQFGPQIVSAKAQSSSHWYVSMTCHWLPCNNVFNDKAIYDITYDVPSGLVAAGQGSLVEELYDAERSRFRWRMRDPIHPHTAGWAVGPFFHFTDACEGFPVEYFVLKGYDLGLRDYFMRLPDMIATFEHAWGPYPGEKIGFAMTDAGSLETHTLVLLDKADMHGAATPQLEAHELAHHWWGNCVTPMDLRENWLSEGFAMYGEILYRANTLMQGQLDREMRRYVSTYIHGIAVSEGIQPLYDYRGQGAKYNYSSVIYIKGALVLNMLRHQMGDSLYHAGLQEYFRRYRYKNVTSTMFRDVMAEFAGEPLEQFFHQWVYEKGWPILYSEQLPGTGTDPLRIRIRQLQTARGWCLYEMPVEIEVALRGGETRRVTRWIHTQEEDVLLINEICCEDVMSWKLDPDGYLLLEMADPTPVRPLNAAPSALRITSCYPQPAMTAGGTLSVAFVSDADGVLQGELRDMLGRRVLHWRQQSEVNALQRRELNISGLPPGMYHVCLRTKNAYATQPVILR